MNVEEKVDKIVNSIKSLNIDINKETTQKLADSFEPSFKMWIIQRYVFEFAVIIALLISLFMILFVANNLITLSINNRLIF